MEDSKEEQKPPGRFSGRRKTVFKWNVDVQCSAVWSLVCALTRSCNPKRGTREVVVPDKEAETDLSLFEKHCTNLCFSWVWGWFPWAQSTLNARFHLLVFASAHLVWTGPRSLKCLNLTQNRTAKLVKSPLKITPHKILWLLLTFNYFRNMGLGAQRGWTQLVFSDQMYYLYWKKTPSDVGTTRISHALFNARVDDHGVNNEHILMEKVVRTQIYHS